MQVLIIAPHMDDEVLGCGGTIVRHVEQGDNITVCVVANRAYNHKYDPALIDREKISCEKAKEILGYQKLIYLDLPDEQLDRSQIDIIVPLEEVMKQQTPDLVYLPHRGDLNQDHRAVFESVRVVCRPSAHNKPISLRAYEIPSSSDQVPSVSEWAFLPNLYVNIKDTLEQKLKAMESYTNESRSFPHPRSPEGLKIFAKKRGMEVGMEAAEAFVVLRDAWK